jgi:hypothetical protein
MGLVGGLLFFTLGQDTSSYLTFYAGCRLSLLPATQVARVRSLVSARPTISVENLALFCNPASGCTLQALQMHCIVG